MVVAILLFIVAILLFGASAVLTVFTRGLALVLMIPAGFLCYYLGQKVPLMAWQVVGTLIAAGIVWLWIVHVRQQVALAKRTAMIHEQSERRRAEIREEHERKMALICPKTDFHADAPTKEERKAIRARLRRHERDSETGSDKTRNETIL